jgi:hypothetical protein
MGPEPLQSSCKVTPGPSCPSAVARTRRQFQILCREPVDSLSLYVWLYGLCGAFFEEKLDLGVSPDCARKMGQYITASLPIHKYGDETAIL